MSFQRAEQPVVLKGAKAARAFFAPNIAASRPGDWWVAHVDEQVRCTHLQQYRSDDSAGGPLPVGAILADAVRLGSAGLLLATRTDSSSGGRCTDDAARNLALAAEAIDLTLLDQLTFGEERCFSMRRGGLI